MDLSPQQVVDQIAAWSDGERGVFFSRLARKYLLISSLSEHQKAALNALFVKKKLLVSLPTGSGKSLLYILPSLMSSYPVVVVSPLIALMMDQVTKLRSFKIEANFFSYEQSPQEQSQIKASLQAGKLRLLFVSPERFCTLDFVQLMRSCQPLLLGIDEAHCVTTWGNSFRTDYQKIHHYACVFSPPLHLALTATASPDSRDLIREKALGGESGDYQIPPLSFNLKISVERLKKERTKKACLWEILKKSRGKKTIVYLNQKKDCDQLASELRLAHWHAAAFHSELSRGEKERILQSCRDAEEMIICATLALSLGLDLDGISQVICFGFPKDLEELTQMWGRCGRQKEAGSVFLLWTGADPMKRLFQIEKTFPESLSFSEDLEHIKSYFLGDQSEYLLNDRVLSSFALVQALKLTNLLHENRAFEIFWEVSHFSLEEVEKALKLLPYETQRRRLLHFFLEQEKIAQRRQCVFSQKALEIELQLSLFEQRRLFVYFHQEGLWKSVEKHSRQFPYCLSLQSQTFDGFLGLYEKRRKQLIQRLEDLKWFAQSRNCRVQFLNTYFTREPFPQACGVCDVCRSPSFLESWA